CEQEAGGHRRSKERGEGETRLTAAMHPRAQHPQVSVRHIRVVLDAYSWVGACREPSTCRKEDAQPPTSVSAHIIPAPTHGAHKHDTQDTHEDFSRHDTPLGRTWSGQARQQDATKTKWRQRTTSGLTSEQTDQRWVDCGCARM